MDQKREQTRLLCAWQAVVVAMTPLPVWQRRQIVSALEVMVRDFEKRKPGDKGIDAAVVAEIASKLTIGEVPS
jgi:predicted RNA polymerase sigma factor